MAFKFFVKLENIGPHIATEINSSISSLKIGLFAMNGEGKSFISRSFAATTPFANRDSSTTDVLLSLGQNNGKFAFSIDNNGSLLMKLSRGTSPVIENFSPYIFHVFNNDYVLSNLEKQSYSPVGDYEGYVVGQANIDITADEAHIHTLTQEGLQLKKLIETAIEEKVKDLQIYAVRKNTTEFRAITYDNIVQKNYSNENETPSEVIKSLQKLKQLPENTPDIVLPESETNLGFFAEIKEILENIYTVENFTNDFLDKMRNNRKFIESGMVQLSSTHDVCPFCGQPLEEDSKKLLLKYQKYLSGEEAKVNKKIDLLLDNCRRLEQDRKEQISALLQAQNVFNELKAYFPLYAEKALVTPPKADDFSEVLNSLINLLLAKKNDISKPIAGVQDVFEKFISLSTLYENAYTATRQEIHKLNKAKNNLSDELLLLRKRLCNATRNELIQDQEECIDNIEKIRTDLVKAKEELKIKKAQQQIAKSDLISETFSRLISYFFGEKYEISFDSRAFSIVFKKHSLKEYAPHVLSDGEKSIIAFCYYLASTHMLVNSDTDYNKIFFIIDDPISSMDYNYVYTMTQIIRDLKKIFPYIEHDKFLILTHSIEFMGILNRNKIFSAQYILHNGKISTLKGQLILPYEAHLRDIYEVANGTTEPTHTTGNSIRHVLETLWRFERPDLPTLREYFNTLDGLKDNSFLLFTLSNDLSHGAVRLEMPFDPITIQNACAAIINYMKDHYEGQLTQLSKG